MQTTSRVWVIIVTLFILSILVEAAPDLSSELNFSDNTSTPQISNLSIESEDNNPDLGSSYTFQSESFRTDTQFENAFGTCTLLTPLTDQKWEVSPQICGDYVVWAGYVNNSYDIILYQLSTGIETDLTPDPEILNDAEVPYPDQDAPAIDGNCIVWQDSRNTNWDIYLYDLSTGNITPITENTNESNQVLPDISGGSIVWADDRHKGYSTYDLYLFDLSSREETILSPNMTEVSLEHPHISGHYVVCEGLDLFNLTYDIYLCNLQDASWNLLTPSTSSTDQKNADIFGDYVVWDGFDELNGTTDVYVYSIPSGSTYLLTNDTTQSSQTNPSIYNTTVVWEDSRFKEGGSTAIVLSDLVAGTHYLLTPDTVTEQRSPEVFGNRIVWQGLSFDWNWDIYLLTLGTEKPELEANFSANVSVGKYPLSVAFSDTSTGEPEFWHWEFGDGNSSDEKNPMHIYDTPGSYDVTLSTGNPYQRDSERKEAFVGVQAPPVCRFSADPVTGIAPLTVQFSDETSGEPQSWHWDFGEGNTSDLENPVYQFSNPGTYTITLTVMNSYGNGTLSKSDMIMVANATEMTMDFDIPGISIEQNVGNQVLILDGNVSPPYVMNGDGQVLLVYPDNASGISEMKFQAGIGGFSVLGNSVTGIISSVFLSGQDIEYYPAKADHGHIGIFNFSVSPNYYPAEGSLHSQIWEGVFPEDYKNFDKALDDYTPFGDIHDIAYTINLESTGFEGGCTITAGVDSAWVRNFGEGDNGTFTLETTPPGASVTIDSVYRGLTPINVTGLDPGEHQVTIDLRGYDVEKYTVRIRDERESIKILKINDDGTAEVLNTSYLYHDPVQNLDYFRASSPGGMSRFAVSALGGPGNPFQMLYLSISQAVKPKTSSGGGGGGGTSSGVAGAGTPITQVPTQSPSAIQTPIPTVTHMQEASPSPTEIPGSETHQESGQEGVPTATSEQAGMSTAIFTEGTTAMVLLKNLSVVGVVVIVTVVFYFRWKREEE
ncbi:MAG: PKD domain-containing protein [Methanoregulaceae archaeon]|nr:PKD domain-containing protein [Methanoregulaceae archaeon]